jgi:hypothetical protein
VERLGAALVDFVLNVPKVGGVGNPVVVDIDIAGLSHDGVAGLALVVEIGAWLFGNDAAFPEHAAIPHAVAFLVDFDHLNALVVNVNPALVDGPVVEGVVRAVPGPSRHPAAVKGGVDSPPVHSVFRGQSLGVVGVHPFGDAHVSGVLEVRPARPRVIEELAPPNGDQINVTLLAAQRDHHGASAAEQLVLEQILLFVVESVGLSDVAKAVGCHVGAVGVIRGSAKGARVGPAVVVHAEDAIDRHLEAVDHDVGLTPLLEFGLVLTGQLFAVVVPVVRFLNLPAVLGDVLEVLEALFPLVMRLLVLLRLHRFPGVGHFSGLLVEEFFAVVHRGLGHLCHLPAGCRLSAFFENLGPPVVFGGLCLFGGLGGADFGVDGQFAHAVGGVAVFVVERASKDP